MHEFIFQHEKSRLENFVPTGIVENQWGNDYNPSVGDESPLGPSSFGI